MGKYDDLSDEEKEVLQRMAGVYDVEHVNRFGVTWDFSRQSHCLVPLDGEGTGRICDVPSKEPFYRDLENKGLVTVGRDETAHGISLEIYLQQPAIDYAQYADKTRVGRWKEDCRHALVEENTVWSKFFWMGVGFLLGVLSTIASGIALRLLGCIEIGN